MYHKTRVFSTFSTTADTTNYKQLHGTAMGSPVSVVVGEIAMQNIEEQALAAYTRTYTSLVWLRYVDDALAAVHKDGIDDFHEHFNRPTRAYSSPRRSKKVVRYLFETVWSLATTTGYERLFIQKTDTYRPITRPVIVQPDLSQGYYYPDSDETSATSLQLT